MEIPTFPMRINKYLAFKQHATRRGADELIEQGKVFINGRKAVLGDKVKESDIVEVHGLTKKKSKYLYFAFNKPKNSHEHPKLPPGVLALMTLSEHDHGLTIYTNDGRITESATSPHSSPEKEYVVRTQTPIRDSFQEKMEGGVEFDGFVSTDCRVKVINDDTFVIALKEGKKNQVRRMCSALHTEVADLLRTRVANVVIGLLPEGQTRPIKEDELAEFLKILGF